MNCPIGPVPRLGASRSVGILLSTCAGSRSPIAAPCEERKPEFDADDDAFTFPQLEARRLFHGALFGDANRLRAIE